MSKKLRWGLGVFIVLFVIGGVFLGRQSDTESEKVYKTAPSEAVKERPIAGADKQTPAKVSEQPTDAPADSITPTAEQPITEKPINPPDDINTGQQALPGVLHIRGLTSSNPFFADGVPKHLQCPTDLIGKYHHEVSAEEAEKIQGISLEVTEKYNPNRPIADIWDQFIAAEKFYHENSPVEGRKLTTSQGRADWTVQAVLDYPEIEQIIIDDWDRFFDVWMVELGKLDPNWNLHRLPDGREFRTKTGYRYEFTYTKDPDNPSSPITTRGFSHSNPATATLIKVNLNETSDKELERLSGWNYNINPYTNGEFSLGGNRK